jgi:exopolysaccharide production protein ExoQ
MSPYIALAVTLTFIGFAFSADSANESRFSRAIWIPFIWMIISASRSLSQWLNIEFANLDYATASLQGNPIDQGFLALLVGSAIPVIWARRELIGNLLRDNKAILAFFVYFGVSAVWSDVPLVSLRKWLRLFAGFLMVVVILTEGHPYDAVVMLLRRCAYILVPLSLVYIKYFPDMGVLYTQYGEKILAGVTLEKNTLGHLCSASGILLFWGIVTKRGIESSKKRSRKRIVELITLVISISLLISSDSSTSLAALIAGAVVCLVLPVPLVRRNIKYIGALAIVSICAFVALEMVAGIVETIIELLGRDTTVTGRAPLWAWLIELGMKRPVFGYGYGGFWIGERFDLVYEALKLTFHIGHNGYLDTFVEGGGVGLILLICIIVTSFNTIKRVIIVDFEYGVLCMALFVLILLCNITESSFAKPQDLLWYIFLLIGFSVPVIRSGNAKSPGTESEHRRRVSMRSSQLDIHITNSEVR